MRGKQSCGTSNDLKGARHFEANRIHFFVPQTSFCMLLLPVYMHSNRFCGEGWYRPCPMVAGQTLSSTFGLHSFHPVPLGFFGVWLDPLSVPHPIRQPPVPHRTAREGRRFLWHSPAAWSGKGIPPG